MDDTHLQQACDACGQRMKIPRTFEGKVIKCRRCGDPFRVRTDSPMQPMHDTPRPDSEQANEPVSGIRESFGNLTSKKSLLKVLAGSLFLNFCFVVWVGSGDSSSSSGSSEPTTLAESESGSLKALQSELQSREALLQDRTEALNRKEREFEQQLQRATSEQDSPLNVRTEAVDGTAMVRVSVWDDTEAKPLHDRAEIWFRGHGSWFLKQAVKFGGGTRDLGRRQIGVIHSGDESIQLYPAGRDGEEVSIPLKMTQGMNPDGSARDMITVSIEDQQIKVVGLPVEEATGKSELTFKR